MEMNKPLELQELVSYIKKSFIDPKEDNDSFTKLIIDENITEALAMLDNNKELKFNRDLLDACDSNGTCNTYFNTLIKTICIKVKSYVDIIRLIQFLTPENMIGRDCYDECKELIHNYTDYFQVCIHNGYIIKARAIYIMFDVDNTKLLLKYISHNRLKELKIAYSIITESQAVIPLNRQNIPILDIVEFVTNVFCFDIIEWYYSVNPKAYTKDKIHEVLRIISIKYKDQLPKFEKFFETVNI